MDKESAYLLLNKYITTKDQDDHYDGEVITIKNG